MRRDRAVDLLAAGLSIEQIAPQVGYSSSSAFVHAFKRWHGVAPGAYRKAAIIWRARGANRARGSQGIN